MAVYRFPGRGALIVIVNALLGVTPLSSWDLLSTFYCHAPGHLGHSAYYLCTAAMIIAQCMLAIPIVMALVHRMTVGLWATYGDALLTDGATRFRSIWIA